MPDGFAPVAQILEWDSQFFGRRIARLSGNRLTRELIPQIDAWCHAHKPECLYLLADADHSETSHLAAKHGYEFVDARVTLERSLTSLANTSGENSDAIRPATTADLPALREMAGRLHRDSRFFFDQRFDPALSERMFQVWIEKSCSRTDGQVFVAQFQDRVAGYLACHRADSHGQIDLIGVDDFAQGNGLGTKLISAALQSFHHQHLQSVQVVTQGRNVRAQRLYQRSGFVTRSIELWYHRWLQSPQ